MTPFYIPYRQSYADVATEQGIDTAQFLEATEGVIKLFDLLGSSAFLIVQNDMKGNVKVREWILVEVWKYWLIRVRFYCIENPRSTFG